REVIYEIADSPHKVYKGPSTVLAEGAGANLEKCRLACTMLRSLTIPARIVGINGRYAVEYYIRALEKGSGWFIMDFEPDENEGYEPSWWHPLDAKESLYEMWDNEMFVEKRKESIVYLPGDTEGIDELFKETAEKGGVFEGSIRKPETRQYFVLRRADYTLWLKEGVSEAKAVFKMAFHLEQEKRTRGFYMKSGDGRLEIRGRRAHSEIKPPQDGIIYTLPVTFRVNE
ncbi:MAG TPA: hypothetical protein ENN43_02550, partial [bacterium]|nr:hypothetical protein [bacterium]